jgi:hypothetical protein
MSIGQQEQQEAAGPPRIETPPSGDELKVPKRITAGLTERVRGELQALMAFIGLGTTDVVNRAVSLYFLVVAHQRAGYEIVFRQKETGNERVVEFL